MAELSPGDKVVYGTFVGTVKQLIGEDECVIGLRAPMSDGAVTIIAKTENCEIVGTLPPESPPEPAQDEEVPGPAPVTEEEPSQPESTETAEESATEESN